jgi:hypothetical protein
MSGLTEGRHELRLNITDAVGNTNSMAPIVWVVDFGPPRSAPPFPLALPCLSFHLDADYFVNARKITNSG